MRILFFVILTGFSFSVAAGGDVARVITSVEKPVQCISPIEVYNIDGKLVKKNAMGFDLEPGTHSLVGTARINNRDCPRMRSGAAVDIPALEYDFEAGKTYYIGLQHKSGSQQNWRFVVWRVTDSQKN